MTDNVDSLCQCQVAVTGFFVSFNTTIVTNFESNSIWCQCFKEHIFFAVFTNISYTPQFYVRNLSFVPSLCYVQRWICTTVVIQHEQHHLILNLK